jgi:hypothetical protein
MAPCMPRKGMASSAGEAPSCRLAFALYCILYVVNKHAYTHLTPSPRDEETPAIIFGSQSIWLNSLSLILSNSGVTVTSGQSHHSPSYQLPCMSVRLYPPQTPSHLTTKNKHRVTKFMRCK